MIDYKVIVNVHSIQIFEKEVNKHIDLGYEPVGGISVIARPTQHPVYYQARQKSSKTKMTRVGGRKKASVKRTKKKPIH